VGLVIFLAVLVSSGLLSWNNFVKDLNQQTEMLQGTAKVFSASVAEPLAEGNVRQVQLALTAIGKFSRFQHASVEDKNGNTFAEMGFDNYLKNSNVKLTDSDLLTILFNEDVWVSDEIVNSGQVIGIFHLLSDISDIRKNLYSAILLNLGLAVALAIFAIIVCRSLVKSITLPIRFLSGEMQRMGEDGNYEINLPEENRGEIGVLARSFEKLISDIDHRDQQLRNHQATLEKRVIERTSELSIAKESAEKANRAKSDFLATMSHEIRTPMSGMLVMAELLATADLSAKHRRYAEVVMKSGKSLLNILNDILDFSKIQSGKMDIENVELDLPSVIDDVLSLFWQQADSKGVDLGCRYQPNAPQFIKGDPTRLNQIMSNLVNNALKFTSKGEISVEVDFEEDGGDTGRLIVSVKDTGIGIAPEKAAGIFESFTQADQSTTREYGGTGLGLAICKSLVEAMSGKIRVESESGKGSVFSFTIPCEVVRSRQEKVEKPDRFEGKKVLVSIASKLTRQILTEVLERSGIRQPDFLSGEATPAQIAEYDWVIADTAFFTSNYFTNDTQIRIAISRIGDTELEGLMGRSAVHDFTQHPLTTISFENQLIRIAAKGSQQRHSSKRNSGPVKPAFNNCRVLVVEDNPVNREVAQQALGQFAIRPDFAPNGLEAVHAAQSNTYDLILMDCSMPVLDGFKATSQIRENEKAAGKDPVTIVALSAHIGAEVLDKIKTSGMNDNLAKPFTMAALETCLVTWLSEFRTDAAEAGDSANIITTKTAEPGILDDDLFDPDLAQNLMEMAGSGYDQMRKQLHDLYLKNAPAIFDTLSQAYSSRDMETVAKSAHGLKSMSMNIAARRLADSLEPLEKAKSCDAITVEFTVMQHEYLLLIAALEHMAGEDQGEPGQQLSAGANEN